MGLDQSERRDLIALLCRVAWADGVVVEAERRRLELALSWLGDGTVSRDELATWLERGPPRVTTLLSAEAKQLFLEEALRLMAADCDLHPEEMRTVREIVNYYFTRLSELMVG